MNPVKNLINKKVIAALILILLAGIVYFNLKSSTLFSKLKNLKGDYEKLTQNYEKMTRDNQELKGSYSKLQKDSQATSLERDNLLTQARGLLEDRERARALEAEVNKLKGDIEELQKEKKAVINQNLGVKDGINRIVAEKEQLLREKARLEDELNKEKQGYTLKKLQQENASLTKEKNSLGSSLKTAQSESLKNAGDALRLKQELAKAKDDLQRIKKEIAEANRKLGELTARYSEAVSKNKLFEQKTADMPKKFAEVARQNKSLIKETANMHYNLGVFYTKNKEYSRAAAELEKAIELTPDDAYAHFNLGYIYAEYMINRNKAIEHFKHYLRLAKKEDKDVDWVKKYILTWQAYEGKENIQ
ncbi:MAG: tetratricopeptide repeat protein [Candidatus Omnitrophota bacterium]